MRRTRWTGRRALIAAATAAAAVATVSSPARADVIIEGVQPVSFDQPRVYVILRDPVTNEPLTIDDPETPDFDPVFAPIQAFLDTGASGILLSNETADALFVQTLTYDDNGIERPVIFRDIGVAGSAEFRIAEELNYSIAPFPGQLETIADDTQIDQNFYTHRGSPARAHVGPFPFQENPFLQNLDIVGMPVMTGKVAVMDPTPVEQIDFMKTWLYDPANPPPPDANDPGPGIPDTDVTVRLSYADFGPFTEVDPPEWDGEEFPPPTLDHNPFIGPNPFDTTPEPGAPPGIDIRFNGQGSTGSYLLDSGGAASIISEQQASTLHVRYVDGTFDSDDPQLETFDPLDPEAPGTLLARQFDIPLGGIGGEVNAAGFYLDSLTLPTTTENVIFDVAPVIVLDITVMDGLGNSFTLDGIFGMNYLVASLSLDEDLASIGAFDRIVFDFTSDLEGEMRLRYQSFIPEPGTMSVVLVGAALLLARRRGRIH